jgi:hypothetical protein
VQNNAQSRFFNFSRVFFYIHNCITSRLSKQSLCRRQSNGESADPAGKFHSPNSRTTPNRLTTNALRLKDENKKIQSVIKFMRHQEKKL